MKDGSGKNGGAGESAPEAANRVFGVVEQYGVRIGVGLIVAAFAVYVTGIVPPLLSIEDLTLHWGLRADAFVARTGLPAGWGWTEMLGFSDVMGLAALIFLVGVVPAAYAALLVPFWRARDWPYLVLVVLQLGVFALAASGWLGGAH